LRVLFVNHTGAASGAEYALVGLARGVQRRHRVVVACPSQGPLAQLLDEAAVQRTSVPAFEASLRLDPVQTPVNLLRLAAGGVALWGAARHLRADLVHANTPRAGLIGGIARLLGGPPVVVRAHEALAPSPLGRQVRRVLGHSASAVLTVSKEVARSFNQGLDRPLATHVYNGVDLDRFDPARVPAAGVRRELRIPAGAALLAHVAQITPWKGQDTSIQALAQLRREGIDAHLLLVGEVAFSGRGVRYDNEGYLRDLHALVVQHELTGRVHFLGQRDDVPGLLKEIDLSLLPSWDEPFANVMLESMAMSTPLLVSDVGGGPELVEDGVSGRLLAPKRPEVWAQAIRELLADRPSLELLGERAREVTGEFSAEAHVRAMLRAYEIVLQQGEQDPARVAEALQKRPAGATTARRFVRSEQAAPSSVEAPARPPAQ
jgi:glycosyltransferase involved in cell wall biosynthesis